MTEKGSETEGREVKGFQQEVLRKNERTVVDRKGEWRRQWRHGIHLSAAFGLMA